MNTQSSINAFGLRYKNLDIILSMILLHNSSWAYTDTRISSSPTSSLTQKQTSQKQPPVSKARSYSNFHGKAPKPVNLARSFNRNGFVLLHHVSSKQAHKTRSPSGLISQPFSAWTGSKHCFQALLQAAAALRVQCAIWGNNSSNDWVWRSLFYIMFQYFSGIYKPGLVPGLGIISQKRNMP